MESTAEPGPPAAEDRPGRPWAKGIGILLLGLAVSAGANAIGLQGESSPVVRTLGAAGYLAGLVVSGSGIHGILWAYPTRRARWARVLLTAVVTLPAFAAVAIVLSLVLTITHMRFG